MSILRRRPEDLSIPEVPFLSLVVTETQLQEGLDRQQLLAAMGILDHAIEGTRASLSEGKHLDPVVIGRRYRDGRTTVTQVIPRHIAQWIISGIPYGEPGVESAWIISAFLMPFVAV